MHLVQITHSSRSRQEKLNVPKIIKKFPALYKTPMFIIVFTTACHFSVSCVRPLPKKLSPVLICDLLTVSKLEGHRQRLSCPQLFSQYICSYRTCLVASPPPATQELEYRSIYLKWVYNVQPALRIGFISLRKFSERTTYKLTYTNT